MGKTNDQLILEALEIYPVMTVEMIAKEIGIADFEQRVAQMVPTALKSAPSL